MKKILAILKKIGSFCYTYLDKILLIAIIVILAVRGCTNNDTIKDTIIVPSDSTNTTTIISSDKSFSDLKKENKALYDSLKSYKDEIDFLLQFDYSKKYKTEVVYTNAVDKTVYEKDESGNLNELEDSVYTYQNEKNDTLQYNLQIASKVEPSWYKMDLAINDKFTIVNKSYGTNNITTVTTATDGDVSNVTMYQKKESTSFWKRFAVGPQVNVGYDVVNRKFGVGVGVGVTFNLLPNK